MIGNVRKGLKGRSQRLRISQQMGLRELKKRSKGGQYSGRGRFTQQLSARHRTLHEMRCRAYRMMSSEFEKKVGAHKDNGGTHATFGIANQHGISVRNYVTHQEKPSVELWPPATELRSRTIAKQTSKKIEELCQAKTTEMLTPYEKELTTTFWNTLTENERLRLCLILGLSLGDANPNFHLSNEESCAEFSKEMNNAREARVLQRGLDQKVTKLVLSIQILRNYVRIHAFETATLSVDQQALIDPVSIPLLGPGTFKGQFDRLKKLFKPMSDTELAQHLDQTKPVIQVNTPHPCKASTRLAERELRKLLVGEPMNMESIISKIPYRPKSGPLARYEHDEASMNATLEYQCKSLNKLYESIFEDFDDSSMTAREELIFNALINAIPNEIIDWSTECDRNPTSPPNYLLTKCAQIATYIEFFRKQLQHINLDFQTSEITQLTNLFDELNDRIKTTRPQEVHVSYEVNVDNIDHHETPIGEVHDICEKFNEIKQLLIKLCESLKKSSSKHKVLANLLLPTIRSAGLSQVRIGFEDRSDLIDAVDQEDWRKVDGTVQVFKIAAKLGWVRDAIAADFKGTGCYEDMLYIIQKLQLPIIPIIPLIEEVSFEKNEAFFMAIVFPLGNAKTPEDAHRIIQGIIRSKGVLAMLAGSDAAIRAGRVPAMIYQHFFKLSADRLLDTYKPIIINALKNSDTDLSQYPDAIKTTVNHLRNYFKTIKEAINLVGLFEVNVERGTGSSGDRQGGAHTPQIIADIPRAIDQTLETVQSGQSSYETPQLAVRKASAALTRPLMAPVASQKDLGELAWYGGAFYRSFLSFVENKALMDVLLRAVCAERFSKVATSPRKVGASSTEKAGKLDWWESQRAIGRVGIIRLTLFMHNIYASPHAENLSKDTVSNVKSPLLKFLIEYQQAATTSAKYPSLMDQQSIRLTEDNHNTLLGFFGKFKQRAVTNVDANPKIRKKFEIMNNITTSILRLAYHLDLSQNILEKIDSGTPISSTEKTQIQAIAKDFSYSLNDSGSFRDGIIGLNQMLEQDFDAQCRLYFTAYIR